MLQIAVLPILKDNYVFIGNIGSLAFVVDPGDGDSVLDHVSKYGLSVGWVLVTHHHADHTSGISQIKKRFSDAQVIVPLSEKDLLPCWDSLAVDEIYLCGTHVKVLELHGHTLGHVGYFFTEEKLLFCGDVLFSAGCGRVFEGTHLQMFESIEKIASLPGDTTIYCAHEYTRDNLRFAMSIEPENIAIKNYWNSIKGHRYSTIPTTLEQEKNINPFLRIKEYQKNQFPELTEAEIFAILRKRKDSFQC
ncbi:hydroxyacylglutathione hydrolase [Neorickettsia helminthoeca str. Oregon]|uniref:Hydroxyacylglutathione hydrolase n=1 Tax=Neorickettsia helminthoeca str. Oregon TaxID=1286528 RepID=X5HLW3_9RICK|nr:hydroxyacylglutathione hydrolase [Neorickettsia helminthoeca]AHX11420.1 hydroxyacylglutathione hydrolase [Neorickettsia helminthoeca str. Oregon]